MCGGSSTSELPAGPVSAITMTGVCHTFSRATTTRLHGRTHSGSEIRVSEFSKLSIEFLSILETKAVFPDVGLVAEDQRQEVNLDGGPEIDIVADSATHTHASPPA